MERNVVVRACGSCSIPHLNHAAPHHQNQCPLTEKTQEWVSFIGLWFLLPARKTCWWKLPIKPTPSLFACNLNALGLWVKSYRPQSTWERDLENKELNSVNPHHDSRAWFCPQDHLVEQRGPGTLDTYLVSSRYHSKSGAGTAEASHLSEAFRPVVASLLLDSVIVGGSVEKTGTDWRESQRVLQNFHALRKDYLTGELHERNSLQASFTWILWSAEWHWSLENEIKIRDD